MESPLPLSELDQSGSNAPLVHINDVAGFSPLSGLGVSRYRYSYPHSRHLDSLLVAKESDTLIVQFHGAVNREKVMLPRFERLATLSSQNVSSMYFADPGLWVNPDISITWYTGWKNTRPQHDIASMVITTAEKLGVEKVIIVGDSGGGFAALQVSALVPNSVCVVFNPTTTIYKYYTSGNYRRTDVQQQYVEAMHPEVLESMGGTFEPKTDWSRDLTDDVSALKRYSNPTSNYVIFIQNSNDWHYTQHYLPFLAAAAKGNNLARVRSVEYEGKRGHFSPSKELYLQGIKLGEAATTIAADGANLDTLDVAELSPKVDLRFEAPGGKETELLEPRKVVLPENSLEFSDIDSFRNFVTTENVGSGVYSIGRDLPIIARWTNKGSPVTLVTFSAALTKNAAPTVPIFSGRRTTSGLHANVLMLSDPSLIISKKLMLGWYAGNAELGEIQSTVCRIINLFSRQTQVVLFGASGGGFAALDQATRIPGSKALVINPQTDIKKYSYYPRYREIVWGGEFAMIPDNELPIRTSIVEEYSKPVKTRVVYVQNIGDKHHYEDQMQPFKDQLHADNPVLFVERDLGQGHFGPDGDSMQRLFELITTVSETNELKRKLAEVELVSVKPQ